METTPPRAWLPWNWYGLNEGIEELVVNQVLSLPVSSVTPNGGLLVACWDKPIWNISSLREYSNQPVLPGGAGKNEVRHCWQISASPFDNSYLAANVSWEGHSHGFSTDGGVDWQAFPTQPWIEDGYQSWGGGLAVARPGNVVIVGGDSVPRYTTDGGRTWADIEIPGLADVKAAGQETGLVFAHYLDRKIITYDPLTQKFYLFIYPSKDSVSYSGVWTSSTGAAWTKVLAGDILGQGGQSKYNSKLLAAPGKSGNLFFLSGDQGNVARRSRNGGSNWSDVRGLIASHMAWGKKKNGTDAHLPIYAYGRLNGVAGLYRSFDDAANWDRLSGRFIGGHLDNVSALEADKNVFGRVYVGYSGSGARYWDFQ
jgi:hypothetical protein